MSDQGLGEILEQVVGHFRRRNLQLLHPYPKQILGLNEQLPLGVEYFTVPAQEVTDDMLEDFAKALIGQQSEIRKYRVAGVPGTFR